MLAEQAQIRAGFISLFENGHRMMSITNLQNLCSIMGVPISLIFLLSEADNESIKPYMPLIYSDILQKVSKQ